jgi:hypothetical protein
MGLPAQNEKGKRIAQETPSSQKLEKLRNRGGTRGQERVKKLALGDGCHVLVILQAVSKILPRILFAYSEFHRLPVSH